MSLAPELPNGRRVDLRKEPRTDVVRIVEYCEFPRRDAAGEPRVAYTRNVSRSGACIGVDRPEAVGSLLRLAFHDLDGSPGEPFVGRVAWTRDREDGCHWMGIQLLAGGTDLAVASSQTQAVASS